MTDDDPIPHRALKYVGREHNLMADGDLMDGWKLPREAYNAALERVRDEYGVDPGRADLGAGKREHTAVLPAAVPDLTTAASGWETGRRCLSSGRDGIAGVGGRCRSRA